MADLQSALANIPGLAGYLAKKQLNEQQPIQQLQQASGALGVANAIQQQQELAKVRDAISSGGSPEEVIQKLMAAGPSGIAAAGNYAKTQSALQQAKVMQGVTGGAPGSMDLTDPATVRKLGLATNHPGLLAEADRLQKLKENEAALATMRRTKGPNGELTGGHFASLMASEIPAIANQARTAQSQLDVPNSAIPAQHWADLQKQLASQEATILETRTRGKSEQAKLNEDLKAGRITKQQFDAAIANKQGSPEAIEGTAQMIANRQMPALSGFAMRSPMGAQIMARVRELDPNYQAGDFNVALQAEKGFTSGKQGNTVRSFNVAINHLGTLDKLADALGNGNVPLINKAAQEVAQQTGAPAPVQFDAAKKIVGDEIVKAIVGSGGGVTDRQEAEKAVSRANSPAQLKGVISTYKELMRGQLNGLQKQYEASTKKKDFEERFLTPEAQGVATHAEPAAAPAPAGSGWSIKPVGG